MLRKTNFLLLPVVLVCLVVCPVKSDDEPHPSLKKLIAEAKTQYEWRVLRTGYDFEPIEVRKNFFGNEAGFLREVASLLQEGEDSDIWDAYTLILFLNISDEGILKIVREKFPALSSFVQHRFLLFLTLHQGQNTRNFDFLVTVLQQPEYPPVYRVTIAEGLSKYKYFESLEVEQKDRILNALLSCLDDDREFLRGYMITFPAKVGDEIAFLLGNLGLSAKAAVPTIRKKLLAAQDNDVHTKLQLSWSVVRILAEPCDELEYLLQIATDYEPEENDDRFQAIELLGMIPPNLAEKVVLCLQAAIQKETCITGKLTVIESLRAILKEQEEIAAEQEIREMFGEK